MSAETIFYLVCGVSAAIMLVYYLKRKRKVTSLLFGSVSGLTALLLTNYFGASAGADIPLNLFNVCGSAVLGVPFVAGMIVVKYI